MHHRYWSVFLRSSRNMKLLAPTTSTALTALCVTSQSSFWLTHAWTTKPLSTPVSMAVTKRHFGTLIKSAVAPDEEVSSSFTEEEEALMPTTPPPPPTGNPVANGTIVSYFCGGLVAIQVSDEALVVSTSGESNSVASQDWMGRHVRFPNGTIGMVLAQRPPILYCYTASHDTDDYIQSRTVQVLDSTAQVKMTRDGGVLVDCCAGNIQMMTPSITNMDTWQRDIFGTIPQVADIALINTPMLTGETMVDALAPIGRGQNMLVIGSDLQDLRGLATDFITTQHLQDIQCIYAVTHDVDTALKRLKDAGILKQTIVVSVQTDEKENVDPASHAAEAVAVAATACAIGEAFARDEGKHALVIVDTIDEFKVFWDATTRVLVDVFGVDAVVQDDRNGGASSEMRAFYSSLIQRAGQYKKSKGGGSVTLTLLTSVPGNDNVDESTVHNVSEFDGCSDKIKARLDVLIKKNIPLTAANLRKIDIPIPTVSEGQKRLALQHIDDLISMSDGQIWFDDQLKQQGQSPAMDPQKCITRIGIGADTNSRADAPAIRRMVEGLRLDLSQAASMDGAEATAASSKQIRKRSAWLLAMHQEPGRGGRTLAQSCIALLSASNGALDDTIEAGGLAGTEQGQSVMRDLIAHVEKAAPDAVKEINDTLDISPTRRTELVDAIDSFFS